MTATTNRCENNKIPDNWRIVDDQADPASQAAEALSDCFAPNKSQLFMSAGGSSIQVLNTNTEWGLSGKKNITVLDERLATDNIKNRNYHQLKNSRLVKECGSNQWCSLMNPWPPEPESPDHFAQFWAHKLRGWHRANKNKETIALIGIGTDGHIAGVMPNSKKEFAARYNTNQWIVGYQDTDNNLSFPNRITTTPHFITHQIDAAIVFAVGEQKQATLQTLVSENVPVHDQPAQLLKCLPVTLITDQCID